jgi:hypothetical protein
MPFVSCSYAAATYQPKLLDCNGDPLPAGTEVATCADLAAVTIADATETVKGKVELATTGEAAAGTSTTTVVTPAGLKAALDAAAPNLKTCSGADMAFDAQVPTCTEMNAAIAAAATTVPDATDTVKGIAALNAGTSLPGDATNCTDALTACGLNALLADTTAGGNAVINNVKALVPLATTTIPGLIEEATGEETRLGATDPNKADRAVTPESMSYALQTGKDYPIDVAATVTAGSSRQTRMMQFGTKEAYLAAMSLDGILSAGHVSGTTGTGFPAISFSGNTGLLTSDSNRRNSVTITLPGQSAFPDALIQLKGTTIVQAADGHAPATLFTVQGTTTSAAYVTSSDATLKENVEAIDPAKALQFRNGLQWKRYEMFTEQQEPIMQDVTDSEGNTTQVPTGRYEVKRSSQGIKRGLIAQEVLALAQSIGDFTDVVVEVGEYFTLDAQGYPVKDAQGNNIVNKRLGIDYDAVSFCVMCAEQSLTLGA